MSATLKTLTLGCKVNQYETEYVRQGLQQAGFRDAEQSEGADLCIVNTCTVTAEGDSKSRQAIRRLARENPNARIVVMGCYATRAPEEVRQLPQVTEVVTDKRELPDLLGRFGVIDIPTGISAFSGRHRAFIKVQDGCLLRCSYCIIPMVRPELASRPADDIIQEARRLIDNGFREIVLTGIHLGHYGVDWNRNLPREQWTQLADLVDRLAQLPGEFRIRLSSIEATEVSRRLIDVMASHPDKIAPHLHICLQAGSDRVLRRMRRRWGTKMFLDRCALVREKLDAPALSTDIIVGFPGETDEDFEDTLRVSSEAGFSKIHVFPYSPRRGTPAASYTDQVDKQVQRERCERLTELERKLQLEYYRSLIGKPLQVLFENPGDSGTWRGTACRYAPVQHATTENLEYQLATVVPLELRDGILVT